MTQRRRRRFGSIRRRSSGSYQVRYWGPDDVRHSAPMTFARKSDAERWLTLLEGRVIRGEWSPPSAPRITLAEYAQAWIAQRSLEPRTRELYESQLRNHIEPYLGRKTLDTITPQTIRNWRQQLLEAGRSATVAAKSYRLLRAVLNTAVKEDQLIAENPCRIPGYDKEVSPERPVGTIPQVIALSELVAPRFRALVLLAAFTGLRWGELVAVRRCDLDLDAGTVRISRKFAELRDGRRVAGPPKSAAGVRVVALPAMLVDAMKRHLAEFPAEGRGTGLPRPPWCPVASQQLSSIGSLVTERCAGGSSGRIPLPRSTPHWQQPGSGKRCQHPRADAPHGPRHHACCIDLPARDGRAGSRDRGCVAVPDRTRTQGDGAHRGPKARSRRIIFGPGAEERGR